MRLTPNWLTKSSLILAGMALGFVGGCRWGHLGGNQKGQQAEGFGGGLVSASPSDRASRETPVVRAIRKVAAAVVNISTEKTVTQSAHPFGGFFQNDPFFDKFFQDVFPKQQVQQNTLGSGVVVDPKGLVLTNHHVLLPASEIKLTLKDGTSHRATLIGGDAQFDIAILQMEGKPPFPYATMGDSDDLMIGETVIAIGNPFGLESSVTTGVISALDRSVRISKDRVFNGFIQTDALINPGNSGGPLVNINGEVIGINTAIYNEAQGIGFAIPVKRAHQVVRQLQTFGKVKRGWLGIRVKDMNNDVREHFGLPKETGGVLVTGVEKDSPAAKAGLKPGDVLLKTGSHTLGEASDFYQDTGDLIVNDAVTLTLWQKGNTREVNVRAVEIGPEAARSVLENLVGATLSPVDPAARQRYGLVADKGFVVSSVITGGQSQRIGIQPGDVFLRVDNVELNRPKDVQDAVNLAYGKASFVALVQRGRQGYWITFEF